MRYRPALILIAGLALALLCSVGVLAAPAVPDQKPGAVQDESGKLTAAQVQALTAALGALTHARYKVLVLPSLGNDPDGFLDAVWAAWRPGGDVALLMAGVDTGRLRLQLGQGVGSGYGVDVTALAREAYNPRAAAGDITGGLTALAQAIEAQLSRGGAPALSPPVKAESGKAPSPRQPWHNPLVDLDARYWWLVAAIVQAFAAVLLALWATAPGRRRRRALH